MTDLTDLIARVEKLEGPDREVDAAIYKFFGDGAVSRWGDWSWRENNYGIWTTMPALTASLDASLALVERVLPGALCDLGNALGGRFEATIYAPQSDISAVRPTRALALILALLRALESQTAHA